MRAWDPNLRPQFTQQWNVFVERLLTQSMSANIGYVGHKATHLVTPVEGNQPLPGTGDVSTWAPLQQRRPLFATAPLLTNISTTAARGRSDYKGLQASVRQRNVSGLEYLASYTLSEVRTNNLGYYGSGGVAAEGAYWMNAYNPDANYGPAFFDARHNFVLSANYELPFGKGRRGGSDSSGLVEGILGGWRLGGILQARTGFPITVIDGSNPSLQGVRGNERPNCVGNPVPSDQTIDRWLDIAAFSRAARGRSGTAASASRARPATGISTGSREAVQCRRRARFRVPGGGVQPDEHAQLRSAGARHQRAQHVRPDHEHRQQRTDVELVVKFFF